jgi:hypothetical protein
VRDLEHRTVIAVPPQEKWTVAAARPSGLICQDRIIASTPAGRASVKGDKVGHLLIYAHMEDWLVSSLPMPDAIALSTALQRAFPDQRVEPGDLRSLRQTGERVSASTETPVRPRRA